MRTSNNRTTQTRVVKHLKGDTDTLLKNFKPIVMKTRNILVIMILLQATLGFGQVRISTFAGYAPAQKINAQNIPIGVAPEGEEYALRATRKNASYVAGVGIEKDLNSCFFLASELRYMYESNDYEMFLINELATSESTAEPSMKYATKNHRLSVPLSVGARIGNFRMLSGFDMNFAVASNSTLENQFPQYSYDPEVLSFGWHTGAGVVFGHVGVEIRYSQDFRNIGQDNAFGDQSIKFYGSQSRWLGIVSYYF